MTTMKSKLYTRSGDNGTTSLTGGTRADKDSARLEAYGTVDELISWIGLVATTPCLSASLRDNLTVIQRRLFHIGAILSTEPSSNWQPEPFSDEAVGSLEKLIDEIDGQLPPLRRFIIPGGSADSARCHIARTVARRAERRIITMSRTEPVPPAVIKYVNRLSDFLFALAREINRLTETPETLL